MARKLQMVGGSSYSHPGIKNGEQIKLGEIIAVEDDVLADYLEDQFFLDGVDKECPYFAPYDKDDAGDAEDGNVKPVSKRRAPASRKRTAQ